MVEQEFYGGEKVLKFKLSSPTSLFVAISLLLLISLGSRTAQAQQTCPVTDTSDDPSDTGSLRYCVNNASSGETITFASSLNGQTITLNSNNGALTIGTSVTIQGPGANLLTISGGNAVGVFNINGSATVSISGLTIANGYSPLNGGGIVNSGMLTLSNSTLSGNAGPSGGGGIENFGTVVVSNSTLSGNTANSVGNGYGAGGGGIENFGTVTVSNSTFSGNTSNVSLGGGGGGGGGAIVNFTGSVTVSNSTFLLNTSIVSGGSGGGGGGIGNFGAGVTTVSNSTFFGNIGNSSGSGSGGGGIANFGGTVTVNNSTLSGDTGGFGGGIQNTGTLTVSDSIVAGNITTGNPGNDCSGCGTQSPYNLISSSGNIIKPLLAPLGWYGGPTQTMIPLPDSPALGAGQVSATDDPSTDQRGFFRNSNTGAIIDVGAVQTNYLIVTTTADQADASPACDSSSDSPCSFRDAMTLANNGTNLQGADITFNSSVTGTINLTTVNSPLAQVNGDLNLLGPGANNLTISGGGSRAVDAIFTVNSGADAALSGITIANGYGQRAGGINNYGATLIVSNSAISGNADYGFEQGGGIFNNGILTVSDSTISNNTVTGPYGGGGIENNGTLTMMNSTVSGNTAGYGGGIANFGTVTVSNSTFAGNTATTGGGISNYQAVTLTNSVVAGNTTTGTPGDDCDGCGTQSPYNLINTTSNSQIDPMLAALGNYGGPTQTMLPLPGSPAICGGSAANIPTGVTTDQRGYPNTNTTYTGYSSGSPCVDSGAVQTNYQSVQFTNVGSGYSGIMNQPVGPAPVLSVTENAQNIGGVPVTLGFSGTGTASGLGPITTVAGTGANFGALSVNMAGSDTLSATLPIVGSFSLSASAGLNISALVLQPTTTTLSSSSNPAISGQSVTLTTTVNATGTPTGSVTFYDGATSLATVPLTGNQVVYSTSSFAAGTHILTATYSGGGTYASSTSATLYQSVITVQSGTVLYGVITNQSTGQPISGAAVTLYNGNEVTVNTDANGNYAINGEQWPYTGSVEIWIVASGYFTPVLSVNVTTPFPVTLNRALIVGGPIVQGMVTDASSGLPIANANVSYSSGAFYPGASTRNVQTDINGNYSIDSSQFNESIATTGTQVSVTVSNSGYLQSSATVQAAPPYPTPQNFSLTPATVTLLQGTVTNQSTGQPISGAAVTLYNGNEVTVNTDANGNYAINGEQWPYTGSVEIWIVASGYFTPVLSVNVTTPFPVTLNRALIVGGPIVQGMVTDASSGLPIANANVSYSSGAFYPGASTRNVQTDINGNYSIDSSQFNESIATTGTQVSVTVSNSGYLQSSATVQAAPPYPTPQNFSLTPATVTLLQGTVTNQSTGQPISGAAVTLYNGNEVTVNTDANGNYAINGEQWPYTGSVEIWIVASGYFTPVLSVNVTTPFPATLNRALIVGGPIVQGMVTDASSGLPIANANVSYSSGAFYPGASTRNVQTDINGYYSIDSSQFNESVATAGTSISLTVASQPGYFQTSSTVAANPPFPQVQNYSLTPTGATSIVTVTTNPPGLNITVDGKSYVAPQGFTWVPGNPHTIATVSPQTGSSGTQYVFSGWSNGGAISQSIATPDSSTTYTASFNSEYLLTTSATPSNQGTVSPVSGTYYNSGTVVNLLATANSGYAFTGWTGNVANPSSASTTVTMNAPQSVTANFAATTQAPKITSATSTTFDAGLAGSFTVTATGVPAPTLSESGTLPSGVTFNAATLSGTPAAGTNGTYNITFTAANGVGSNFVQNFSLSVVNPPVPTLTSVTPVGGVRGTAIPVTLTGTNFTATGTRVSVSGAGVTVGTITVVNSTTITTTFTITATAALTARNVSVTTPGGTSNTQTFTVGPLLTSIAPNTGARGTSVPVTLTGSGLTGTTTINVSGAGVTHSNLTVVNDTTVTATFTITATAGLTARTVSVTTTPGGTSNTVTFTVVAPPVPTLTSVTPAAGVRGTAVPVTLTGTNFTATGTRVSVSGAGVTVGTITVVNSTTITTTFTITATAGLTARTVSVATTPGGTSNTVTFTVVAPPLPTLVSVAPDTFVRGTTTTAMTLTGTNFTTTGTTVAVAPAGGITVSAVNVTSPTTLTATFAIASGTTAAVGAHTVTVTNPAGASNTVSITVQGPTLASISPTTGTHGTTVPVSITGTNLTGATAVTISGSGVTCTGITSTATTVNANCAITTGAARSARNVTVTTPIGTTNSLTGAFTVN